MNVVRLYVWVIRIALSLAAVGQLKSCTMQMAGLAAEKSQHGISYGKFSRMLTAPQSVAKAHSTDRGRKLSP